MGLFLSALHCDAQDPHFTQSSLIPVWYNPALAGNDIEHIRASLLYRNQWSSVTSPFRTEALFVDKQVEPVGFGLGIVNNSSGPSGFRQLYLNGQISYRIRVGDHSIGAGLQVGFMQRSFDPSKMTFDDQYSPDQGFNPAMPTSETFSFIKLTRPDAGAGIHWSYGDIKEKRVRPFVGAAMHHINRTREVFIEENNFIHRRTAVQAGADIRLENGVVITPQTLISRQGPSREWLTSAIIRVPLENRNMVLGGLHYRNGDALALSAGYELNSLLFGMSYDVNISGLTGGPGAFELTLTWIPKEKSKRKQEEINEADLVVQEIKKAVSPGALQYPKKDDSSKNVSRKETVEQEITSPEKPVNEIDGLSGGISAAPPDAADTDQDGIPDKQDRCPFISGGALTAGCPDTDKDGVTDLEDDCPLTAGAEANNGCPSSTGDPDEPARYSARSRGNIEFSSGSNDIHGLYTLDIIEPALDELLTDTTLTLVITGHTDAEGDAAYNMMLSRSRTDAVKSIFIRKGLPENRILTVAYGENRPIRDNSTHEGRQHNRRAELHLMSDSGY